MSDRFNGHKFYHIEKTFECWPQYLLNWVFLNMERKSFKRRPNCIVRLSVKSDFGTTDNIKKIEV